MITPKFVPDFANNLFSPPCHIPHHLIHPSPELCLNHTLLFSLTCFLFLPQNNPSPTLNTSRSFSAPRQASCSHAISSFPVPCFLPGLTLVLSFPVSFRIRILKESSKIMPLFFFIKGLRMDLHGMSYLQISSLRYP